MVENSIKRVRIYRMWSDGNTTAMHIDVLPFIIAKRQKAIQLELTSTQNQIVDFLTKAVTKKQLCDISSKLGIVNIYALV